MLNALPFDRRLRHFMEEQSTPRCFFCQEGEDPTFHVYVECKVVQDAKLVAFSGYPLSPFPGVGGAMLTCPPHIKEAHETVLGVWILGLQM